MRKALALIGIAGALGAVGCSSGGSSKPTGDAGASAPEPARFVTRVDNPWFPLRPGTTYVYRGSKDGQPSRDVFKVTRATKVIQGVRCTAISDRLYKRGRLAERTTDWYAQDRAGNVWYFGEDTAELAPNGKVKTTEGSWQAGVNGARAGILVPAHPRIGQSARQEYYKGHAEDHFRVVSLSASVRTPAASSGRALLTEEWTPLEPGVLDHKVYVRGVGTVSERTVKGGSERNTLVAVTGAPAR
jgi:hypothetical protein